MESMKFFTADQHFGHANIIKYTHRINPETGELFETVEEMNECMTAAWNSVVGPNDTVYQLGDLTKDSNPKPYLRKLNGKVILIRGNHDYRRAASLVKKELFAFHDVLLLRPDKGSANPEQRHPQIWLSHYSHRVWPASYHGSWHLYGHSHATLPDHGLSTDVGVDTRPDNDYKPFSLPEIAKLMAGRRTPKERHENE